jgi:MYXO-CTERM domain-containing protein
MFTCDTSDAGAAGGANGAGGRCVAKVAASCDGKHTLTAPSGAATDCTPYVCAGTGCKASCDSVLDCVYPASCTPDGKCLVSTAATPISAGGGCACTHGPGARTPPREGLVLLAGLALAWARRRRRHAA